MIRTLRAPTLVLLACAQLMLLPGCATLNSVLGGSGAKKPITPHIEVVSTELSHHPNAKQLAAYYCTDYLGPLICRLFGRSDPSQMAFQFDLTLELTNKNPVPLPVVSALVAFKAFPQSDSNQNLGSVCMSFCEDPEHCAQDANACESNEPEIRDARSFATAAAGFLVSTALGERDFKDLRVKTVPANGALRMVIRLSIDPTQMLTLMRHLGRDIRDDLRSGQVPVFAIPLQIEGTAWFSVQSFGRFAAGFGPVSGEWKIGQKS